MTRRHVPAGEATLVDDLVPLDVAARGPHGLSQCLGDAFLVRENPIVRRVRAAVLARGYRFSASPPYDYAGLPLGCLPAIYRTRVIPIRINVPSTRRAMRERPGFYALADLITLGLPSNAITHESVHCLAHELLTRAVRPRRAGDAARHDVLISQLAEACSNAVESLGGYFALTEQHRAFYRLNTFESDPGANREAVKILIDAVGLQDTLVILILGYLAANFLWRRADGAAIDRALSIWIDPGLLGRRVRRAAHAAFREGFSLSRVFRLRTTALYFRALGRREAVTEILDFDFVAPLARNSTLRDALRSLARIVTEDALPARLSHRKGPLRMAGRVRR